MGCAVTPEPCLVPSRGAKRLPLLLLCVLAGSGAVYLAFRGSTRQGADRLALHSPYENVRPGVKYVGDSACVRCHSDIAASYRRQPMGRSLYPIESAPPEAVDPGTDRPLFTAQGLEYSIEARGGRVIHVETRKDSSGRVVARNQAEVRYVLGSGKQAYSYLIERDGFLSESPITWYSRDGRWDLSPNYEIRNYHFDRPIHPDCLFCHANRALHVGGAVNRYREPIFDGHAIGCERCHGPGERHLRRPVVVDGRDVTIVNPANLEPSLRDAVCEQCHLIGRRRISRAGTRSEDYRPGLPFYAFWSAFVLPESAAENRFAGQVEQMRESRCFLASGGRFGCISCHDPHAMPAPEEKAGYYRDRCLACHADRGCGLPVEVRREGERGDDCIGCHMPRSGSSNNTHVATTNHRVPRQGNEAAARPGRGGGAHSRGRTDLVNFHRAAMDPKDRAAAERDRGIALCREGREGAVAALPLLEKALAARSDDLPVIEALGEALGRAGRPGEGLAAFRRAVARDPTRETALSGAADLASKAGRRLDAMGMWQQAIAVNPWRSDYHAELALLHMQAGDWAEAARSCREVLRLNPAFIGARKWLVQCDLQLGNVETARAEFETLLGFDPPDREVLLRWFRSQASYP